MKSPLLGIVALFTLLSFGCSSNRLGNSNSTATTEPPIHWVAYSDDVFAQAKRENKFVLLDLEAVWCHWCHVMDDTTYTDPKVRQLIAEKYIAVKVDQDSRPDISNRYEDYGWPATVVFNGNGGEIVKRRGYMPPDQTASMLQAIIDDPTPGPSVQPEVAIHPADQPVLSDDLRRELQARLVEGYDSEMGGWGHGEQKFLQWENVEYELRQAANGDAAAKSRAMQTLAMARNLIDPVWGGMDQYSTDGDWDHPHYEKIMQVQAEDARIYSMAYRQFHNEDDAISAKKLLGFLGFLCSPEHEFYVSMDADRVGQNSDDYFKLDDAGRKKIGTPHIDKHIYARENGWAIVATIAGRYIPIDQPLVRPPFEVHEEFDTAKWIIEHRSLPGGGFRHDEIDAGGPYLSDTLEMGRAMLQLYNETGDRQSIMHADAAGDFIEKHFVVKGKAGVWSRDLSKAGVLGPTRNVDENVEIARFANMLWYATGKKSHQDLANTAAKFIFSKQVAEGQGLMVGGILLADAELSAPPLHITIVGTKPSVLYNGLYDSALEYPEPYKLVELYDPADGPLPNPQVQFPQLDKIAAFVCTGTACSSPAFDAETLKATILKSTGKSKSFSPLGFH